MCVRERKRDTIKAQEISDVQACGILCHFHMRRVLNVPLPEIIDFYNIAILLLQFQPD